MRGERERERKQEKSELLDATEICFVLLVSFLLKKCFWAFQEILTFPKSTDMTLLKSKCKLIIRSAI